MFDIIVFFHRVRKLALQMSIALCVHVLLENVMSIYKHDALEVVVTAVIKQPVCLNAREASWAYRKRILVFTLNLMPSAPERFIRNPADDLPQLTNWAPGK